MFSGGCSASMSFCCKTRRLWFNGSTRTWTYVAPRASASCQLSCSVSACEATASYPRSMPSTFRSRPAPRSRRCLPLRRNPNRSRIPQTLSVTIQPSLALLISPGAEGISRNKVMPFHRHLSNGWRHDLSSTAGVTLMNLPWLAPVSGNKVRKLPVAMRKGSTARRAIRSPSTFEDDSY